MQQKRQKIYLRKQLFKANGEYATITEHGMPVTGKESTDYIAGVLCENLRICTEEAKASLPKATLGDKVIEC